MRAENAADFSEKTEKSGNLIRLALSQSTIAALKWRFFLQQKFVGHSVLGAIRQAIAGRNVVSSASVALPEEQKTYRRVSAHALPLAWGPWTTVWTQMGVVGSNRDRHVSRIKLSFHATSRWKSSFDVEIKGGDSFVRTLGTDLRL